MTGEKWERVGNANVSILHYTARSPTPIGTDQFIAIDQLSDLLVDAGNSIRGFIGEVFYMITESAKGQAAEDAAWKKLKIKDVTTRHKIAEILHYIKSNPDIRYSLFKSGAFTFQTGVTVIDQIIATNVASTSDMISFVEDKTRRKLADRMGDLAKYVVIAIPLIFAVSIGAVMFLVGGGFIGGS